MNSINNIIKQNGTESLDRATSYRFDVTASNSKDYNEVVFLYRKFCTEIA
jgi:hypothetical protein